MCSNYGFAIKSADEPLCAGANQLILSYFTPYMTLLKILLVTLLLGPQRLA
jgi:hypothetical protein